MKNLKKIAGFLLALTMAFGLRAVTDAAGGNGTITVQGVEANKTVNIYKIFDLTYFGSSDPKNVSYTIDSDWADFFREDGNGAQYIIEKNNAENTLNPIVIGDAEKYINITDSNVSAFSDAALKYTIASNLEPDKTQAAGTEASNTVTLDGLDLGYYLVYPVGASEKKNDTYSCVCSLNSTVPDGTVDIKATYPAIEKTVDKPSGVQVGETVTYNITGTVPNTTGFDHYTYKITDEMSAGLTFQKDVAVKFGSEDITVHDNDKVTIDYSSKINGFILNFDMTKYQAYKGQAITVTYSAVVNEQAVAVVSNNTATLTYSNDPANNTKTDTTPSVEEKVFSAKIVINKIDEKDNKLAGAEFVLKNKEGKFYKSTIDAEEKLTKVEWIGGDGNVPQDADKVTTNEEGTANFPGLKNGTYYLVEVKAPDGYNKLTGEVKVVVQGNDDNDITDLTVTSDRIVNKTGSVLPTTGGMGTTLFYIIGGLLAAGAAVLLIVKRRMNEEE